ncbi:F-box protein PP2-B10-like isoform X2 [Phragmites australis]|uniref:F-box protein PP2-B10-like isoform X2 n=1 Tax=Phragmites australis TaxID=29695 RepID=UPI002D78D518|nr:F-box protein PP2-B10-like isoform X2 [Phragmites australis]
MAVEESREGTQVGDLPEVCLAHAIALTSPRDACRCAAVSPAFRAAADSDHVWCSFLPKLDRQSTIVLQTPTARSTKKDAYLGLCDAGAPVDDGLVRVWLEKASGAKCYALSARRLSLPWDDGEFCWKWTPQPLSRFAEVAELVDCTCLDIYSHLPAAALTPATAYAAYLVYGTADGHRGLSYPDQETTVSVGGRVVARHAVCLRPDDANACKFRGAGLRCGEGEEPRRPRLREDGWWEMEMGRLCTTSTGGEQEGEEEVVASFEVLGWYSKCGLIVESIEFRPI